VRIWIVNLSRLDYNGIARTSRTQAGLESWANFFVREKEWRVFARIDEVLRISQLPKSKQQFINQFINQFTDQFADLFPKESMVKTNAGCCKP